jgi:hypothetical protein
LALLLVALALQLVGPAAAQEGASTATAPQPLSERLRAQGHAVDAVHAAYLDADERAREEFVELLVVVDVLASARPGDAEGWRFFLLDTLQLLVGLDPTHTPVEPPPGFAEVHAHSLAYRQHLHTAGRQWLAAVRDRDPAWYQRGAIEYAAAERVRLAWHKALWERYTGEPAPGP